MLEKLDIFFFVQVFDRFRLDYFMLSFWSNYVCKLTRSYISLVSLFPRYTGKFYARVVKVWFITLAVSNILTHMAIHKMAFLDFSVVSTPLDIILDFCICWLQSAGSP